MSERKSPLARLVLFIVILSVAGTLVAGVFCFAVDHALQDVVQPKNEYISNCEGKCYAESWQCDADAKRQCTKDYSYLGDSAVKYCVEKYYEVCYKSTNSCLWHCENG